ncbi:DUF2202 domain-containing protein [Ancylomarina sp. YFZ004]
MKTIILFPFSLFVMSMICIILMSTTCEQDPVRNSDPNAKSENQQMLSVSSDNLTEEEIASLMFMVEEEKLARDVYDVMYGLYGLRIFYNINNSEVRHVSAISYLIEKYELTNPNDTHDPGVFDNEELQRLYDDLIDKGSISVIEAIAVGVLIEETDLEDIQYYLDHVVESKDIERVYENLLAGSENHLAAFLSHQ